jgi:hypothetical protein
MMHGFRIHGKEKRAEQVAVKFHAMRAEIFLRKALDVEDGVWQASPQVSTALRSRR